MKKVKTVFLCIFAIIFVIAAIGTIAYSVIGFIHGLKNPENTFTQNLLWTWGKGMSYFMVSLIISYLGLFFIHDEGKKTNNKTETDKDP